MAKKKLNFPNNKRKETDKWDGPVDARGHQEAGKHPNQHVFKTRSGHSVIYDDTKDLESLTIQHRSGTALQMLPGGGLQFTAHNGKYEIIFGEEKVVIEGVQDITVKGDCSLRVYGDYRQTVHGNMEISATGSIVHKAKNIVQTSSDNHSVVSQNITNKASEAAQYSANKKLSVVSKSAVVAALEDLHLGSDKAQFYTKQAMLVKSDGTTTLHTGSTFDQTVMGKASHDYQDSHVTKVAQDMTTQILNNKNVIVGGQNSESTGGNKSISVAGAKVVAAATIEMQPMTPPAAITPPNINIVEPTIQPKPHIPSPGQPKSPNRQLA